MESHVDEVSDRADSLYASSILSDIERTSLLSDNTSSAFSQADSQSDDTELSDPERRAAQAAKAIEAAGPEAEAATSSRSPSTPPSTRPPSLAAGSFWSQHDAGPAPPLYAEIAAWQSAFGQPPVRANPSSESEEGDDASSYLSVNAKKRSRCMSLARRYWKSLCLVNLAIYCVITTIVLVFHLATRQHAPASPLPGGGPSWTKAARYHTNTSECRLLPHDGFKYFGWRRPTNFSFVEVMQPLLEHASSNYRISGRVDIRPAPHHQEGPIEGIVSVSKNQHWSAGLPEFEHFPNGMRVSYSRPPELILQPQADMRGDLKRRGDEGIECLDIWIGIYVKTAPDNLEVRTENLNIDFSMPASYNDSKRSTGHVYDDTHISSKNGNITISGLDSRRAAVTSASGSITGHFALNDHLHLETRTGELFADIEQITAHENGYLASHPPGSPANLSTRTGTGSQYVSILQGLNGLVWADYLGYGYGYLLDSHHISDTGSITFTTNDYWEGSVTAETVNGSIDLRGAELKYPTSKDDGVSFGKGIKRVEARKGTEHSVMRVESREGDVDVCIDDIFACPWHFEKV